MRFFGSIYNILSLNNWHRLAHRYRFILLLRRSRLLDQPNLLSNKYWSSLVDKELERAKLTNLVVRVCLR
jgi:hypothetical protein